MRRLNRTSLNKIKLWEGLRLSAYQDQAGVWTIGFGHTGPDVYEGLSITEEQAEELLLEDIAEAQAAVDQLVKVDLTDNQYGALVSFVFNVGVGAFSKSTLLRKLNAGDYASVPNELARWNKITVNGKKVANRGLSNRRAAEAGLWAKGESAPSTSMDEKAMPKDNPAYKKPEVQGPTVMATAAVGDQFTNTANQISMFAEYSEYIRLAFMVLMFAGLGLTVYGLIKRNKGD